MLCSTGTIYYLLGVSLSTTVKKFKWYGPICFMRKHTSKLFHQLENIEWQCAHIEKYKINLSISQWENKLRCLLKLLLLANVVIYRLKFVPLCLLWTQSRLLGKCFSTVLDHHKQRSNPWRKIDHAQLFQCYVNWR